MVMEDYYEKWLRIIQEEQRLRELPFIEIEDLEVIDEEIEDIDRFGIGNDSFNGVPSH